MPAAAILALLLAVSPASRALDPSRPLAEFDLRHWSSNDGLPANLVNDVIQSDDGYIWIATWLGTARFNGREFVLYDQNALPWVRDGSAVDLALGRNGELITTSNRYGVSVLRDRRWSPYPWVGEEAPSLFMSIQDAQGRLWMAGELGVDRIDGDSRQRFSSENGLPGPAALWMAEDADGSIWVAAARGVARIDQTGVLAFGTDDGLPPGEIGVVLVQRDGVVRVGTKQGAYALRDGRFQREPQELPLDQVSTLLEDSHGTLWIGTAGSGLFRFGRSGLDHIGASQGLPNDHVNALAEDREGNLWIGTHGGLARLAETRIASYARSEGLADDFVRAVTEDAAGAVWVATNGGVSRIIGGRVESLGERNERGALPALSLLALADGAMWVGSYSHGVSVFDGSTVRTLDRSDGLVGEEVRSMIQSRDGSIWIGTSTGLSRWQSGVPIKNWSTLQGSQRIPYVRALLEDSAGRIWVGLQPGLAMVDGDALRPVADLVDSGNAVVGMVECIHGNIWFGGQAGLHRWRGEQLDTLDSRFGLADSTVFALQSDGDGTDWISTGRGLLLVSHDQLEAAMDGSIDALDLQRIGEPASAESLELSGGSTPSMLLAHDQRFWLATAKGVAVIDPQKLKREVEQPPVVIESIEVDGAESRVQSQLDLPPGTRRIEFRYAGLSYAAAGVLNYRYRLKGYDPDWVDADRATTASYTNLAPAAYLFEVEARIEGAEGSPRHGVQSFTIKPYVYQTVAFQTGSLLTLLLLVILTFRWRMQSLRQRSHELQRLVDLRTYELSERSRKLHDSDQEKAGLIAQLREQSLILERHAREDGLTGLANRRRLDALLQEALASGAEVVVALIDIDHFKQVNDRHGHGAGDEVLRRIGALIRSWGEGAIAGRYGGEEFAVAFVEASVTAATAWSESLRLAVEQTSFEDISRGLQITLSVGVAGVHRGCTDINALYAAADQCLYTAKRQGRNRVVSAS